MRQFSEKAALAAAMFLLIVGLEHRAYAYTDPGSGLLAVQYLFSLAAGAIFYFRHKLARLFRSRTPQPETTKEEPVVHDGNSSN